MKALLLIFITFVFGMSLFNCSSDDDNELEVKTFVLVHGAWQAPYVWEEVKLGLEKAGHQVLVVELPGHGNDNTSPATLSIDVYRDKVIQTLNSLKQKSILVGHSMGGVVVTAVAEKVPERIEKLIYIGAFVPSNGQSLLDLALQDPQSKLGPALIPSEDQLTLDIKRENIVSIFCQDAPADKQALVLNKFRAEPAIPFTNPVVITEGNYGSVNKYYIHTGLDQAIGSELQKKMVSEAKITQEYTINSGHSPFLSLPNDVIATLLDIVQ